MIRQFLGIYRALPSEIPRWKALVKTRITLGFSHLSATGKHFEE